MVVENANEAIFVTQDEKVIFVNPRALVISGYDRKTLTSRPFTRLCAIPRTRHWSLKPTSDVWPGRKYPGQYVFRFIHRRRPHHVHRTACRPGDLGTASPQPLNFMLDVTERVQHQEELSYHGPARSPDRGV